jgi:hypothetical protein
MGWHTDVVNTGIGRYATREEAVQEARGWAAAEEMPFREDASDGAR